MPQISVQAEYFNLLPSGGFMPNFTGTFFVNDDGTVSLNHEVLALNNAPMSRWEYFGKSKKGVKGINIWIAGENFLIIDDKALEVAYPFFKKHLTKFKS